MKKVFNKEKSNQDNIILPSNKEADFEYILTYLRAGDVLLKAAINPSNPGLSVPAILLYRHAIELHIKSLLVSINRFISLSSKHSGSYQTHYSEDELNARLITHNIAKLFKEFTERYKEVMGIVPFKPDTNKLVNELHQFDSTGDSFRYAKNTKGKSSRNRDYYCNHSNLKNAVHKLMKAMLLISIDIEDRCGSLGEVSEE